MLRVASWGFAIVAAAGSNLSIVPRAIGMASAPESSEFSDLMDQGEDAEVAKDYPMAFERYARAYRSVAADPRRREDAALAIDYALRVSNELLTLDDGNLAVLRSQADLFREYLEGPGSEEARKDVVDHLAMLDARLMALEPMVAPAPVDPTPTSERAAPEPEAEPAPEPITSRPVSPAKAAHTTGHEDAPANPLDERDVIPLGIGAASFAGGIAMIAGGGWVFGETTRRANALVARAEAEIAEADSRPRTEEEMERDSAAISRFTEELDDFRRQSRARATALVVVGSILAGAGIGVSAWSLVKIRNKRKRVGHRATLSPAFTRRQLGVHFAVSF